MKFALIGYGKMGKIIEEILLSSKSRDEIVLRVNRNNLEELSTQNLQKADVAIEFSTPASVIDNIYRCFDAGIPVVVGTTAWFEKLDEVKAMCKEKNGALFYSPNFSIGVNIFWAVNRRLAAIMNNQNQYEPRIEETHHIHKLDAPSGTAIRTAEILLEELKYKSDWVSKAARTNTDVKMQHQVDHPKPTDLLIVAKREDDVPGTHIVSYESDVDSIRLVHEARNRKGFAKGAIMAARWLAGKKGVYNMNDLLSIG
jgi:4-hydroxy-tetrahydrodipicolinate reductase